MPTKWNDLLEQNRLYSQNKHRPQPYLNESQALGIPPPSTFIYSCVDFRASPEQLLDLKGEEAFIVRNLGGRLKTGLSNLLYVDFLTQGRVITDVVIIHHTDCGLTHSTDDAFHEALKAKQPQLADEIDKMEIGAYDGSDLLKHEETIREDLKIFKASQLIRQELKDRVHGYVYDIKSGKLISVPYTVNSHDR